jgi:hypothetical protein
MVVAHEHEQFDQLYVVVLGRNRFPRGVGYGREVMEFIDGPQQGTVKFIPSLGKGSFLYVREILRSESFARRDQRVLTELIL